MTTTEQVPAAAPAAQSSWTPGGVAAPPGDELSAAQLAAAFSRSRKARTSGPAPVATPSQNNQPAEPAGTTTPVPEPGATEQPNAASTPAPELAAEQVPMPELGQEQVPLPGAEPEVLPLAETETIVPGAEPEPNGELEPKGIAEMRKRIDVLTARLREAERAQQQQPPAPTPVPVPPGEYSADPELSALNVEFNKWQGLNEWLNENPNGGEIVNKETGDVVQTVDPELARRLRLQADDALDELRAQRAARKRELRAQDELVRTQAEQQVASRFPWSTNPQSPQSQFISSLVQRVPELQRLPGWKLYAAHAIDSFMRTNQAVPLAGSPRGVPPRVVPPNGQNTQRIDPIQRQLADAEVAFEKSGKESDFKRVQVLRRQIKNRGS